MAPSPPAAKPPGVSSLFTAATQFYAERLTRTASALSPANRLAITQLARRRDALVLQIFEGRQTLSALAAAAAGATGR